MSLLLGLVLAAQPAPAQSPVPISNARPMSGHISDQDYPVRLARRRVHGTTAVKFLVNERGRIAACEVTASSGSAELDAIVCRLLQRRFRFEPARLAGGKRVSQWLGSRWTWAPPRNINLEAPSFAPLP